MLKSLYIDGLRSLRDFNLELQPELNVLIGKSGSGKSNIMTAFDLISNLSHLDSPSFQEKIIQNNPNGIASLFDLNRTDKKIVIKFVGETKPPTFGNLVDVPKDLHETKYEYECEIDFKNHQKLNLEFSRQLLELELQPKHNKSSPKSARIEYDGNKVTVHTINEVFLKNSSRVSNLKQIESFCNTDKGKLTYRSLLSEFQHLLSPLAYINQEVCSCACYIFSPQLIRASLQEPIFPNHNENGRGLSYALYRIFEEKGKDGVTEISQILPFLNFKDTNDIIYSYLNLLIPEFKDIKFKCVTNLNLVETNIEFNNGVTVPLINMSDGTLKFLALLVAVLTTQQTFVLDAPENYIHPNMQHLVVDLIRSSLKFRQSVGIISTNSESFINSLDPSEVLLTNFRDGRTMVNRIEDMQTLRESLGDTGFGLSWYYVTGALDPYP